MQAILDHIDAYIDKIIAAKLKSSQEETIATFLKNQELTLLIRTVVKENVIVQNYVLTEADVERVAARVQEHLTAYLATLKRELRHESSNEIQRSMADLSLNLATAQRSDEAAKKNDIDIDQISLRVLESPRLADLLANYLKVPDSDVSQLRVELNDLRGHLTTNSGRVNDLRNDLEAIRNGYDALAALVAKLGAENDNKLNQLMVDLNARITTIEAAATSTLSESMIDERVRKILVAVLGGSEDMDLNAMAIYIRSVFVTRDYLEERLNRLHVERDDKVKADLDKLGALLLVDVMQKVSEQFKKTMVKQTVVNANYDDEYIRKIVRGILAVYDADKTAMPDYALETAGGQVISIKCTQVYQHKTAQISIFGIPLWYQTSTPRIVITPSVHPGQCWAFAGFPGYIGK